MSDDFDRVRSLIQAAGYGTLATCDDGQPRIRPMAFVLLDDGRLWTSTYRCSGKFDELRRNARVEVCFVSPQREHLRITGTVDTTGGPDAKRDLLARNPNVRRHFPDEHAEQFVHIEITPTRIRWTEPGFGPYHEVERLRA